MMGDLAFQFRSWMRPNWNRYFGARWNRSVYNEAMGSYRKGAYISLGEYLGSPINNAINIRREQDLSVMQTIGNIVQGYGTFLTNARVHWKELSLQDRQNAMRAVQNLANIVTVGGLLTLISALSGDGEDDEQTYAMALAIYELNAVFTETAEFVPVIGWAGTLTRTKQYTMASERVLFEWMKLAKLIGLYPLQDDYTRQYQQGIYKGQSKLFVSGMKNIPIVRQGHKFAYIPAYTSWYKLYNPFAGVTDMFKTKKEDK